MMKDVRNHTCPREESWWEYDARGIPLCRVCNECKQLKLSAFRLEVRENPNYTADEPIEEEDS